ncbi:glutamate synthase-related protein [Salinicoccus sp. Marseille-QA3877]
MGKFSDYLPSAMIGTALATPLAYLAYLYKKDNRQKQHAILRNFPLLGRVRYVSEHVGPELRQYLFSADDEGEPFSRLEFQSVVKAGKYNQRLVGFGSDKDFEEEGYFIRNSLFPNRFVEYDTFPKLFDFIEELREVGGKPVGMKIVVGDIEGVEEMARVMKDSGKGPDFITIDGGEGGTGATYQELADSVGLPILTALPIVDELLRNYGVRDRVKLIASGKLITPDKAAIALAMGADLIHIARGFMISVGCIMAEVCHTNTCPVGVATTDAKLQEGLIIDEKLYRVSNYVTSLREGLFNIAAAAGVDSPTKLERKHIIYKDGKGRIEPVENMLEKIQRDEDDE